MSRRKHARSRGSTLVEAALAIPIVMMLVSSVIDYARIHHTRSRMQNAVSQATRFAITGNRLADDDNPGFFLTREASIARLVREISRIDDIDGDEIEVVTVEPDGRISPGAGGPGDVVLVRVTHEVAVLTPGLSRFFPGGRYRFTCTSRFRNEEFVA
jgi:hypothetical protein